MKNPPGTEKKETEQLFGLRYSERESNPHDHCWSQDFKSGVSTYSTIRAFCRAPMLGACAANLVNFS